jgi:hypothetical protein
MMVKTLEVKTMKGTVVMAKMAGMESTANELWRKSRGGSTRQRRAPGGR